MAISQVQRNQPEEKTRAEFENSTVYHDLSDKNQLGKYWLLEAPEVLETQKNVIRYYPRHEKLVVHLPDYYSPRTRSKHIGKGVGLDLAALAENHDILLRLVEILQLIEEKRIN